MAKEENDYVKRHWKKGPGCGACGIVYGFGLLGAAYYFIQNATSIGDGVFGVLKAIIWPAMFVYKFLEFFRF